VLARLLEKIAPGFFARQAVNRQRADLAALPRTLCDVAHLATLTAEALAEALRQPASMTEWPAVAAELQPWKLAAMTGGVNPGDQRALYALVRFLRPRRVLEIGTHLGCSTLNLALAARQNRAAPDPVATAITTVDIRDVNDPATRPWVHYGGAHSPAEMIRGCHCADFVTFTVAGSLDFLGQPQPGYDLIFLDGDHSAPTVYQEIPRALQRLNPGGFILLHDYFPGLRPLWSNNAVVPGVALALERFTREGFAGTVLPLGALPWPTKLGSHVTSLALLARPALPAGT